MPSSAFFYIQYLLQLAMLQDYRIFSDKNKTRKAQAAKFCLREKIDPDKDGAVTNTFQYM